MKKFFLTILIFYLCSSLAFGATFYVDQMGGLDTNDGLSPEAAWKTIAKVNTTLTGDQSDTFVHLKRGGIWREQNTIAGYATAGHPYTWGAYGTDTTVSVTGFALTGGPDYSSDANLQGYWKLEEDGSADRVDSSGKGNNLTAVNTPVQSTYHKQGSYSNDFEREDVDYLTRTVANLSANFPGKAAATGVSMGAWIWVEADVDAWQTILSADDGKGTLRCGTSNKNLAFYTATSISSANNTILAGNGWTHVAMVWDGTNLNLYINGVSAATPVASATWPTGISAWRIGSRADHTGETFDGLIDEVFIFNRSLSSTEISNIYNYRLDGSLGGIANVYYTTFGGNITALTIDGNAGTRKYGTANLSSDYDWTIIGNQLYVYNSVGSPGTVTATVDASYPIISAADGYSAPWTAEGALWYTPGGLASIVIVNGIKCAPYTLKTALNTGTYKYWFDSANNRHYIITDGLINPNAAEIQIGIRDYCIQVVEKSYLAITGFRLQYGRHDGIHASKTGDIEISYNLVEHNGASDTTTGVGIDVPGHTAKTGVNIHHNICNGNLNNAIAIGFLTGALITGNSGDGNTDGIELTSNVVNSTIARNNFSNNLLVATQSVNTGRGFWGWGETTGGHSGNIIAYNIFTNSSNAGIVIDQGTGWVVSNNTISNSNTPVAAVIVQTYGSPHTGIAINFTNNIFYNANGPAYWTAILGQEAGSAVITGNNNLFFNALASPALILNNGITQDFSTWKTASGQTNSLNSDPLFVNPPTDFHLQPTSPCRNAGVNVGLTQDYEGNPVPTDYGPLSIAIGGGSLSISW